MLVSVEVQTLTAEGEMKPVPAELRAALESNPEG